MKNEKHKLILYFTVLLKGALSMEERIWSQPQLGRRDAYEAQETKEEPEKQIPGAAKNEPCIEEIRQHLFGPKKTPKKHLKRTPNGP